MAITPMQRILIQRTFAQAANKVDVVMELFGNRVIEFDPSLQPLFKAERYHQGRKIMETLAIIINSLDKLDILIPLVEGIAKRLTAYGVKRSHYPIFGTALLWTLEKSLGAPFIPDAREAWRSVYGDLSKIAVDAAYPDVAV